MNGFDLVFPCTGPNCNEEFGLTKRELFAAMALQGIMANPERWKQIADDYQSGKKSYKQCSAANAVKAVSLADALIAELSKETGAE